MLYKRYTVEVNGQILSVELAANDWYLREQLKDNNIPYIEEVFEKDKEYNYYGDHEKSEKFIESLVHLTYPELKSNLTKVQRIVKNLRKEFAKYDNIYFDENFSLSEGYSVVVSFDFRDSFVPLYSFKYGAPLLGSIAEETERFVAQIYDRL